MMDSERAATRNKDAKALLAKNFGVSSLPKGRKAGKPGISEQSKTIQMMKLRQSAKPGEPGLGIESVPPQDRLYVQARAEGDFEWFWFRKVFALFTICLTINL